MSFSLEELNQVENFKTQRYINAVYLSLGRPVEVTLRDGRTADAFFAGFDFHTSRLLLRNFCFYMADTVEKQVTLDFADVKFFTAKDVGQRFEQQPPIFDSPEKLAKPKESELDGSVELSVKKKKPGPKVSQTEAKPSSARTTELEAVFRIDKEISLAKFQSMPDKGKSQTNGKSEKRFQRFQFDSGRKDERLEESSFSFQEKFDQFAVNTKIFGVGEEFDENDYTTRLDEQDFSDAQIRKAETIAQDILKQGKNELGVSARHIMEERGLLPLQDNDNEEALYSAVERTQDPTDHMALPAPKAQSRQFPASRFQIVRQTKQTPPSFVGALLSNWRKKKRKTSELIESISVSSDSRPMGVNFAQSPDFPKPFISAFSENNGHGNNNGSNNLHHPSHNGGFGNYFMMWANYPTLNVPVPRLNLPTPPFQYQEFHSLEAYKSSKESEADVARANLN